MAAKPEEVHGDESSHSSLISDTLIEQLQGKGNTNHSQLLATVDASRSDHYQPLQKEDLRDNLNSKSNVDTLEDIEEQPKTNKVGFHSSHHIGPSVSEQDSSQRKSAQEQRQQEQVDTQISQEADIVKQQHSILKEEELDASQNISKSYVEQSENQQNQIDPNTSKQQHHSNTEAMDKYQSGSSYMHFNQDTEVPTKENSGLALNVREGNVDAHRSRRHSSGDYNKFVGDMRDGDNVNSSRRSSLNSQPRGSIENAIDDVRQYSDNSEYHRFSDQGYQAQCDQDCDGRCRNQTIQTCPAPILKHNPGYSERSFDLNQMNHGGHRDRKCPFMRVVSDRTTNAPTSGYSIYDIPCDCQKCIMTSNKKLQTTKENHPANNIRYQCTNSTRPNSSQTVALQDSRGNTNISESREPVSHSECRCSPGIRQTAAPEYQSSEVAPTEYEQHSSRCPESKCDRLETYLNRAESDQQEPPTDYTSPECTCCPTNRSKVMHRYKHLQAEGPDYLQSHMESSRRRCAPGTYPDELGSYECCQPCPGHVSKRRTSRSITCNASLTPRSMRCPSRYSPSDSGDFDQFGTSPPPRRQNRRYLSPAPCNRQPVQRRRTPPLEPPPWCIPDCRKPKSKPKMKCTCNCCCRGNPTPPPPPLPEFFCCPEEEEEEEEVVVSDETSEISDDDCFCDDPGSPMGLSYQDNEEYQQLLMELEEALACRNRNRVRRAIQEFEHRSRLNKPLERPIIDYDETSRSEEPLIEKLSQLRNSRKAGRYRERPACRRSQSRGEKEFRNEEYSRPSSSRRQFRSEPKRESSRLSKWKMDEAGEWYKSPRLQKGSSRSSSPRKNYHNDICMCCACKAYNRRK